MYAQVTFSKEQYEQLWIRIIKYKINNQARVLNILGELGSDIVAKYGASISVENVDCNESLAAKEYFKYYRDGLNRRIDDPINSRLKLNEGAKMVHRSTKQGENNMKRFIIALLCVVCFSPNAIAKIHTIEVVSDPISVEYAKEHNPSNEIIREEK